MKFKKFDGWAKDNYETRVWFETDKGLSGMASFPNNGEAELAIVCHHAEWGKFNPYLFEDEYHEGAPDKELCDATILLFERDKGRFEEREEKLVKWHDEIEEAQKNYR